MATLHKEAQCPYNHNVEYEFTVVGNVTELYPTLDTLEEFYFDIPEPETIEIDTFYSTMSMVTGRAKPATLRVFSAQVVTLLMIKHPDNLILTKTIYNDQEAFY